jgi:hypothetical protein
MNLPSTLALPRSKFFQSRIFFLILALVAVLAGGGIFFAMRSAAPPRTPTPATSPAAQTLVRPVRALPPVVVFGPPAPESIWKPPVLATAPLRPAVATLAPGAVPAPGARAGAVPAPAVPLTAPAVPGAAATGAAVETPNSLEGSALFAREQYAYTGDGRRDPFQSLLDGRFQGSGDASLIDVGDIHLVGIMWGASDKFALVEDSRGRGFVLRVGDPVVNGYISGISKTELQIVQNAFGESQSMSIKLQPKEGDQNAARK